MQLLIVPDIHNQIHHADHWLTTQRYDQAIFLGDYFDDFGDDASDAERTALWLKQRMERTEDVFLLGNHDAAYMFPESLHLYCPGFTVEKSQAIRSILKPEHWERLQLAHEAEGWLFSHAGIHPAWPEEPTLPAIFRRCDEAMGRTRIGLIDPFLGSGADRGGPQPFGGPLWMDWNSLQPIPGIPQIVGHTPGGRAREKSTAESRNYCLDVRNASVAALLCGGELQILERH